MIQFESEGLRTRGASGRKAGPRAGDELVPTPRSEAEKERRVNSSFLPSCAVFVFRP